MNRLVAITLSALSFGCHPSSPKMEMWGVEFETTGCYERHGGSLGSSYAVVKSSSGEAFTIGDAYLACYRSGSARIAHFSDGQYLCMGGRCYPITGYESNAH